MTGTNQKRWYVKGFPDGEPKKLVVVCSPVGVPPPTDPSWRPGGKISIGRMAKLAKAQGWTIEWAILQSDGTLYPIVEPET